MKNLRCIVMAAVLGAGLCLCAQAHAQSARHHDQWRVGTIRITTNASGQVVNVAIIKSSGDRDADAQIAKMWLKRQAEPNVIKILKFDFHRRGDIW